MAVRCYQGARLMALRGIDLLSKKKLKYLKKTSDISHGNSAPVKAPIQRSQTYPIIFISMKLRLSDAV